MFTRNANRIIGYTLALVIVAVVDTHAQQWDLYANVGYASYSQRELRAYQEYVLRNLVVDGTATEKFPPYLTYALGVTRNSPAWSLGVELGHGSTGGRIYYQDYSGTLIADQLLNFNFISLVPTVPLFKREGLTVAAGLKISVIRHKLSIRNQITIRDEKLVEQADFLAGNFGLQPNLYLRRDISSRFFLHGNAGYEIQDNRETISPKNNGAFLSGENGEPVHLQGSGFRLSIGAGVRF